MITASRQGQQVSVHAQGTNRLLTRAVRPRIRHPTSGRAKARPNSWYDKLHKQFYFAGLSGTAHPRPDARKHCPMVGGCRHALSGNDCHPHERPESFFTPESKRVRARAGPLRPDLRKRLQKKGNPPATRRKFKPQRARETAETANQPHHSQSQIVAMHPHAPDRTGRSHR